MNWQPIETATIKPFDKEKWFMNASPYVLLYCKYGDYGAVTIGAFSYTKNGKGRWTHHNGNINPTHWMPLPEPPKNEKNNTISQLIEQMLTLSDEDRMDVLRCFCSYCGSNNPTCQCWNDE